MLVFAAWLCRAPRQDAARPGPAVWYVAGLNDGSIPLDAPALDALMRDDAAHRAAIDPRLGYAPGDAALRDRIFSLFRTPFDLAPDMSRSTWEEAVGLPLVAGSR